MTAHLLTEVTIFVLAVFVGLEVISRYRRPAYAADVGDDAIHGIAGGRDSWWPRSPMRPFAPVIGFVLVLWRR